MSVFRKIKQTLTHSSPQPRSAPPLPPPIPPPTIDLLEKMAAQWDIALKQSLGFDDSQLTPELFAALFACIVDKPTFNFTAARSGRPSEQDLIAFEETIGFALPADFRRYVRTGFGCLFLEVKETVWPRPQAGAIVPAWHLKHGLYVYGLSSSVPDYMDIRKQFAVFSKGGRRIVPFLRIEGSLDHHCFTPEGGIALLRSGKLEPVDLTFSALLLKEIQSLQARVKKIQTEPNPYA